MLTRQQYLARFRRLSKRKGFLEVKEDSLHRDVTALAQQYGVSIDYLLGLDDIHNKRRAIDNNG